MATVTYKGGGYTATTSMADVYQAPASAGNVGLITELRASNIDGAVSANITLVHTDSSNTIKGYYTPLNTPLAAFNGVSVVNGLSVLLAGDKIRAQASANSAISIHYSVREET